MKITGNNILINGGTAGIGFATAALLIKNNRVIISDPDQENLDRTLRRLPGAAGIICDHTNGEDLARLLAFTTREYPGLDIFINDLDDASSYHNTEDDSDFYLSLQRMQANFYAVTRLCEMFTPLLKLQQESAIVNVTSMAVYGERNESDLFRSGKVSVHAYTLALRHILANTGIRVFDLLPPIGNSNRLNDQGLVDLADPGVIAQCLLRGLQTNDLEIRIDPIIESIDKGLVDIVSRFNALN